MSLNNDTPISGLPDTVQDIGLNDLLAISQKTGANQYFTARITIAAVYALFISDINISDVKLLATRLASMQEDIDSKLSGAHTHVIGEISGLQIALDGKAAFTHSHAIGQISGLQAALDSKLDTLTHTHSISQVIGLQAALNQKSALGHSHVIGDTTGLIAALSNKLETSLKGTANGLAELDSTARVPKNQSHLFIIEKPALSSFPLVGESGKYYIAANTGISYRWNGVVYTPLSTGVDYLELGETSTTAYRGDRGKIAYNHSQLTHAPANAQQNVQADWNATSGDAYIKNKPLAMAPLAHAHPYSEINGIKPPTDAQKNVQADWNATSGDAYIKNKPTTFTPSPHSHVYGDITGLKPPTDAQKNSDITKDEIEARLTGAITSHTHDYSSDYLLLTGGTLTGNLYVGTTGATQSAIITGNLLLDGKIFSPFLTVTEAGASIEFSTASLDIVQTSGGVGSLIFNTNRGMFTFNKPITCGVNSPTANGYTSLLNGYLLQWATAAADNTAKSFPIVFPNACFSLTTGTRYGNEWVSYDILSNSQFKLNATGGGNATIMAIGY